jgi:hypothetical protein
MWEFGDWNQDSSILFLKLELEILPKRKEPPNIG